MGVIGGLRRGAYRYLARHRDGRLARALDDLGRFVRAARGDADPSLSGDGEARVLARLAPAGFRVALDAGANVGAWSRAAARAWPGCRVHAFEIAPATARRFGAGAPLDPRITLHALGLSDAPGTVEMVHYPDHPDLTCDRPRFPAYAHERFEGRVTTVDAFCAAHGIARVDFLKIDVEGTEHKVLKGAAAMIAADAVTCIQFEYGAFSIDTRFLLADYYALLADRYAIGKVYPRTVDFADYHWGMEDFRFCNYLCVSRRHPGLHAMVGRR